MLPPSIPPLVTRRECFLLPHNLLLHAIGLVLKDNPLAYGPLIKAPYEAIIDGESAGNPTVVSAARVLSV